VSDQGNFPYFAPSQSCFAPFFLPIETSRHLRKHSFTDQVLPATMSSERYPTDSSVGQRVYATTTERGNPVTGETGQMADATMPRGPFCLAETDARDKNELEKARCSRDKCAYHPGVRYLKTGWWCAQSVCETRLSGDSTLETSGNPLFSAFFSQNGEFKSKRISVSVRAIRRI